MYLQKMSFFYEGRYEVWVKEVLTFLDTRRKFIEKETKNQEFLSVLHPQGTAASTQIVAYPFQTNTSSHITLCKIAVRGKAEVHCPV
jgi:hypothetical protein